LIREVLLHPHPLLTRRAEPATEADAVIADLLDTMRAFGHCVGIAAPQIGESVRVAVVDVTGHRKATTTHGELPDADDLRSQRERGQEEARERRDRRP
jgi:peptide deformylase